MVAAHAGSITATRLEKHCEETPMWTRKELKKGARTSLKANYWRSVLVCILLMIFAGAYASTASSAPHVNVDMEGPEAPRMSGNTTVVNSIVNTIVQAQYNNLPIQEPSINVTASRGVAAAVFDNVTKSGSFIFGLLNAVNQFVFGDTVATGIILLVGAILGFVYWLLVGNLLRVGECRFFLESLCYEDTPVFRVLFLYKVKKVWRPARIMCYRTVYTVLWSLTIVGGFIKGYAYRMVPYVLAENPMLTRRQAFRLSQDMMRGNKWKAFKLDISLLGWELLSSVTFGIAGYLFVNPYTALTSAQLYRTLRQQAIEKQLRYTELLNDRYLFTATGEVVAGEYPEELFTIPQEKHWETKDFHRSYSLRNLVLMFFAFCLIGWVWEVLVDLFQKGVFTNRGTLWGPWLPLYGTGGVLILMLTKRWVDKPLVVVGLVTLICGTAEYLAGWMLETVRGVRYWNYDGYLLNIQGRVCLEGLVVFAIAGSLGVYVLGPALDDLFNRLPSKVKTSLCILLVVLFVGDLCISSFHPNMGDNITFPLATETDSISLKLPGG